MIKTSLQDNLIFNEDKVTTKVLLESPFSKEIRILLKQGQMMKAHKTPYPIVVHLVSGSLDFGVAGNVHHLEEGAMLALEGNTPHDLHALSDSMVRLSISKLDQAERVEALTK